MQALIIVALVVLLFVLATDIIQGPIKTSYYTRIDGEGDSLAARRFVKIANLKIKKTPVDHYHIAQVYDFNIHDPRAAIHSYRAALVGLIEEPPREDNAVILRRIQDRFRLVGEHDQHIGDLPYQLQMLADQAILNSASQNLNVKKEDRLATKVTWINDTQNVHDPVLSDEVARQFNLLKNSQTTVLSLGTIKDCLQKHDYGSSQEDHMAKAKALKMMDYLMEHDGPLTKLGGARESEVLSAVYNKASLQKSGISSMITSLADAYNDGSPVCATGRVSRVMASLAHGGDSQLGILKTREAVRNEIFQKCHLLLDRDLEAKGPEFRDLYNKNDPQTADFITLIKGKISDMIDKEYPDLKADEREKVKSEASEAL